MLLVKSSEVAELIRTTLLGIAVQAAIPLYSILPPPLPSLVTNIRARAAMLYSSISRPACHQCALHQQIRHASLLRRPKRPYTFTQLITLSDGSTFLHRTTSPQPIYRSTKDTKNNALWNPSSQKLLNIEEDEAGRLRRFRRRFGRGFDVEALEQQGEEVCIVWLWGI